MWIALAVLLPALGANANAAVAAPRPDVSPVCQAARLRKDGVPLSGGDEVYYYGSSQGGIEGGAGAPPGPARRGGAAVCLRPGGAAPSIPMRHGGRATGRGAPLSAHRAKLLSPPE